MTCGAHAVLTTIARHGREIAATLYLSPKTVEVHRAHVMDKMQVSSVAELVRLALFAHEESR